MSILRTLIVTGGLVTTLAAQSNRTSWPLNQAPAELRPAISRADLVIVAMHGAVLRDLHRELSERSPARAINFFHLDITAAIQRLERDEGIAAGWTSDRLRNPANAPKPWVAPLVQAHAGQPARSVEGFAVDLGDKVGVLRPIVERPICASCHGPQLAPGVQAAMPLRYRLDRAVGFANGEIRGWYWVEMPKSR